MGDMAEVVHLSKVEVFGFGDSEHFFALLVVEELSFLIEEFESVPLFRVMASGEDDTTCRIEASDRQFGGRGGSKSDIDDIVSYTDKCATYEEIHHFARDACVATYDDGLVVRNHCFALCGICCGETHDIHRA